MEKELEANPPPYFTTVFSTAGTPLPQEVLTRNKFTFVVLLLLALYQLNVGATIFFKILIHFYEGHNLYIAIFVMILAYLLSAFYFFVTFKKDYLLTRNLMVALKLSPILILGLPEGLIELYKLRLINNAHFFGITAYVVLVLWKASRPYCMVSRESL